jgi:hypothetical protein
MDMDVDIGRALFLAERDWWAAAESAIGRIRRASEFEFEFEWG